MIDIRLAAAEDVPSLPASWWAAELAAAAEGQPREKSA
jgi:hypothetical protein